MGATEHDVPPDFRDAVAELLYHSQMIETLLRVYLSDINEAADIALAAEGVRFKHRFDDLGMPLGRLVDMFDAHSDNGELVRRLRAFTEHRNSAAHVAYVWGFVNREKPAAVAAMLEKVRAHCDEASDLVGLVTRETVTTYQLKTDSRLHMLAEHPRKSDTGGGA